MDLLQKYGLFIVINCNKVFSGSLLFINSTDFIALRKRRKRLWSGGESCGLLGFPWTPGLVCVVM